MSAATRECPHCQVAIAMPTVAPGIVALGAYRLHVRACAKHSPEDREHFRLHRRWPERRARKTPTP